MLSSHIRHICIRRASVNSGNASKNVETPPKMWKRLQKCGNIHIIVYKNLCINTYNTQSNKTNLLQKHIHIHTGSTHFEVIAILSIYKGIRTINPLDFVSFEYSKEKPVKTAEENINITKRTLEKYNLLTPDLSVILINRILILWLIQHKIRIIFWLFDHKVCKHLYNTDIYIYISSISSLWSFMSSDYS